MVVVLVDGEMTLGATGDVGDGRYRWSRSRLGGVAVPLESVQGFGVGDQPLLAFSLDGEVEDRLVRVLAAMLAGRTPEEIARELDGGFSSDVEGLLAEPFELEEMRAHARQVAAVVHGWRMPKAA